MNSVKDRSPTNTSRSNRTLESKLDIQIYLGCYFKFEKANELKHPLIVHDTNVYE